MNGMRVFMISYTGGFKLNYMRRLMPFLVSLFLVFTAVAETTHGHAQAGDAPCPAVCISNCCGLVCADTALKSAIIPAEAVNPAAFSFETVFVHRLSEDEIFHPPAV